MSAPAISYSEDSALSVLLDQEFAPERLAELCPESALDARHWQAALYEPLRGFLARSGKEFRASLVRLGYRIAGGAEELPLALPELVEILHAGSLIIDDIEDDSSSRRGAAALHRQIGLPKALNAGNWLYFWPSRLLQQLSLPPVVELSFHRAMNQMLLNCHYGQALDLGATFGEVERAELEPAVRTLSTLKTGSLMGFAAESGALFAGASPSVVRTLNRFGQELGVGLQMLDDLGGIQSERRAQKGHEDLLNGRLTWVWAWLAEAVDATEFELLSQMQAQVQARDLHPEVLCAKIRPVLKKHRVRVHLHLDKAFGELTSAVGLAPGVGELRRTLSVLEKSYD